MGRRAAMGGASKAVAVKLLARDMIDDPDYREMFIDEARLSMLLTHSNVVQVFDVGEADGEIYMVMEWIDGLNLSELTRKLKGEGTTVDYATAAHVIGEVLRGLNYAHGLHHDGSESTIVHRDVSPQNVLLSVSGEVKLADFGVARLASEETSGMHVKGKLRYMAPEQLRGRSREPSVDLYAVGAMFHELIVGEKFRRVRDEGDLYSMVLSGEYQPLPSEVPPLLARLCEDLLEPDPKVRLSTAAEALERLSAWPGYRNRSLEIGRQVRRWVGVTAPRSGIESTVAREATEVPDTQRETVPVGGGATAAMDPTTQLKDTRAVPETRTWQGTREQGESPTAPNMPAASAETSRGMRMWMVLMSLAAVFALCFGVLGLGFGMGWWGGEKASTQAANARGTSEPTARSPEPSGDRAAVDDSSGVRGGPSGGGAVESPSGAVESPSGAVASGGGAVDTPNGESDGGVEESAEAPGAPAEESPSVKRGTEKKSGTGGELKALKPATVQFFTGDFLFVYIKVAGTVIALEPTKRLKVKPGVHRVYFRISEDENWRRSETINLGAGRRYEVRMKKPAGLTLKRL